MTCSRKTSGNTSNLNAEKSSKEKTMEEINYSQWTVSKNKSQTVLLVTLYI